jgi:hypothetical protein
MSDRRNRGRAQPEHPLYFGGPSGGASITVEDVLQFQSALTIAWSQITGEPTTIAGYGITDAYTEAEVDALIAGASGSLAGLADVDLTGLADDDILQYDLASGLWKPVAAGGGGGATDLDGLTDVILVAPSTGNVLRYNGTEWVDADLDFSDLVGLPTTLSGYGITDAYTDAQVDFLLAALALADIGGWPADASGVLTNDGAGALTWETAGGGGGGLQDREDVPHTTASVATGANVQNVIDLGYSSALLMALSADIACRVRFYTTSSARAADLARTDSTDPTPGAGVLCEYIFTGSATFGAEPPVILRNGDGTPTDEIYYTIENRSGSTDTIDVTLTILPMEN